MPAYVPGVDPPGWPLISVLRFDQKLDYFSAKWHWKPEFLEVERSVSVCLDRPVKENHPWKEDTKGPFFERPGNFSVPKVKFEIKTCWIVAQFLAHKPVNFTSWTDDFILVYTHAVILVI